MTSSGFIERQCLLIKQPLADFYAFSLDADTLNKITYSQPAKAVETMSSETATSNPYSVFGSQRTEKRTRLEQIADFIKTDEAVFPNSIILGANYSKNGSLIEDRSSRWRVVKRDGSIYLRIPTEGAPVASIIDGQHRLHGFDKLPLTHPRRRMQLLCVAFLDLPLPFHAYIFATINFNQQPVSRSLAYDLFGFNLDTDKPHFWSPETLAVYFARLLNAEPSSPLVESIRSAVEADDVDDNSNEALVTVSLATIVDGILKLISPRPREDRYKMRESKNVQLGRDALDPIEGLPLRDLYLKGNDKAIYDLLVNYFTGVRSTLWAQGDKSSYVRKTVGVQALFDVLRILLVRYPLKNKFFSATAIREKFSRTGVLANNDRYEASGRGRIKIRDDILTAIGEPPV